MFLEKLIKIYGLFISKNIKFLRNNYYINSQLALNSLSSQFHASLSYIEELV